MSLFKLLTPPPLNLIQRQHIVAVVDLVENSNRVPAGVVDKVITPDSKPQPVGLVSLQQAGQRGSANLCSSNHLLVPAEGDQLIVLSRHGLSKCQHHPTPSSVRRQKLTPLPCAYTSADKISTVSSPGYQSSKIEFHTQIKLSKPWCTVRRSYKISQSCFAGSGPLAPHQNQPPSAS